MFKQLIYLTLGVLIAGLSSCQKDDIVAPLPKVLPSPIPNSTLLLNPSGYAPLSAQLTFSTGGPGTTTVTVHGKHGPDSDVEQHIHDTDTTHVVAILGLYANWANSVEITFTSDNGQVVLADTLTVQTGFLPAKLPTAITVTTPPTAALGGALSLVSNFSSTDPYIPLVVDNYGDIRWLLDFSTHPTLNHLFYDCGISHLRNGNYLFGDRTTSYLYEVDALGQLLNTWKMPGYTFHHEVVEKPDGNFLVTVNKAGSTHPDGSPTEEDVVIEVSRTSGNVTHEWDLKQLLDENRHALETDPVDWAHTNAVVYDPADNTIVVSTRVQGVVKLGYDDRIVWILAPHKGWGSNRRGEDLNNFLLTPLDANGQPIADADVALGTTNHPSFEWNWYQHSPSRMPNGDWLLFDNGSHRNFNPAPGTYSRAVAFRIDPVRRTVQQVWEYGKERGTETYSVIVSRVEYLPGVNHVRFCPGDQVPTATGAGGKIIEVDYATRQPVFEMSLTTNSGFGFHRADMTHFGE
ncbi:aryl-sulfate sulfotransferase [Hymenobacter artigasi]|uniref:Arylsulfate sulfotransferase n=1 Tax=Hymenobacter artigasi TaxID=2719616 RepID=A0ABX1HH61_9BACT|nr:aryl-sulfate sulfotransferase [Hymenobacter artigasi]NKI88118.1 arylsulfate sulfotransferase [Hymenobacter artigasi]